MHTQDEPLFRKTVELAGINKYQFEFVNIREHVSWIHAKEPKSATEKAKKLVAMGVAKAALLEPQKEGESNVIPTAVVIGGGIAGLTAAASLVAQNIDTHLIEAESRLGGNLADIEVVDQSSRGARSSWTCSPRSSGPLRRPMSTCHRRSLM
jgi:heterodisulfide reductase subunit A